MRAEAGAAERPLDLNGDLLTARLRLAVLDLATLRALAAGDHVTASRRTGVPIPVEYADDAWLWDLRAANVACAPDTAPWFVRATILRADRPDAPAGASDTVVGHVGLHGPPVDGAVEVGYTTLARHRGQGYAAEAAGALLRAAASQPEVESVVASVSPGNAPSLAIVRRLGLRQVGEQWDSSDGRELVFSLPAAELLAA